MQKFIPNSNLLTLITKFLDNKAYKVLYNGTETLSFKLKNGVPQGDSLSPTLFCLYINDLFDVLRQDEDTDLAIIGDLKISPVAYADDILLFSQSQKGLIKAIKTVQTFCLENGLKINYDKTKIIIENTQTKYSRLKMMLSDSNYDIEVVDNYKYLGMIINTRNINNKSHIEYLANRGRQSSFTTSKILKDFGQWKHSPRYF